jgi:hypothetical protein
LLTNSVIRNAVKDEVMGAVNHLAGTGSAGPVTQFLGGRIDGQTMMSNMAQSQIQNATFGRLTGAAQTSIANAAGRNFRYGAQIALTPVATQTSNGLSSAVRGGAQVLLP